MNNFKIVEFANVKIIWIDLSWKKYFHKIIHISFFSKHFNKNKRSKLCFEDRVSVLEHIQQFCILLLHSWFLPKFTKHLSNSFVYWFCIFGNVANFSGGLAFMQVRPRLGKHRFATTPAHDRDSHALSETPQIHHPSSLSTSPCVHAALATALLVLYGLYLLLADFLRPLQWALLYSVPLRKTQRALIVFWEPQLRGGLSATLLALPLAALRSSTATHAPRSCAACSWTRDVPAPPPLARLLLSRPLRVPQRECGRLPQREWRPTSWTYEESPRTDRDRMWKLSAVGSTFW